MSKRNAVQELVAILAKVRKRRDDVLHRGETTVDTQRIIACLSVSHALADVEALLSAAIARQLEAGQQDAVAGTGRGTDASREAK